MSLIGYFQNRNFKFLPMFGENIAFFPIGHVPAAQFIRI